MEQELKELKSVLRSLVVSSPTQVDVRSLLRDYRNMMGGPVPLTKYGYRDPVLFLRERFSDCFVFQGPQNNPILTLIVPDTLKHIDEFVQRQKLSSTVKFKGKRRSIPEQVIRAPKQNLIASTFIPNKSNKNSQNSQNITQSQNTQLEPKSHTAPMKSAPTNSVPRMITKNNNSQSEKVPLTKSINKLNIQEKTLSKELIVSNKENAQENNNIAESHDKNCSQTALQNFLKKRLPLYNSSQHIEKYDTDLASSKGDDDSGRQTSSSNNSTKAAAFEELKMEIRDLIAEHPEGVWCTDLIGLYRERYNRELNFSRFGYTSIVSLVCVLDEAVHIRRAPDGQWLLTDARVPAPGPRARRLPPPAAAAAPTTARYAPAPRLDVDVDDALPGIDFDPDVFPPDCMHFMESIPAASLAALETGAMLECILGEVYSPSHFWLLRLGERHHLAMEDMMDEMTQYYTYGAGKERSLALGAVRVGHYCSSVYEGDWHRSLIVRIQDCDTVKVRHIDYGTVESVPVSTLKPLRRAWGALPAQAVRARLAAVRPPAAGRRWPHAAAAHFLRLVRDTRLVANVVAVDREEDILEVFLIDTSTDEDICISTQMIRSGHADARPDSALRTSECYLFPRFDALESGATPNYGEIHAYLRDGISLEYVEDYRRHVPAGLPPAPPSLALPPPAPSSTSGDERPASPASAASPARPATAPPTDSCLTRASSSPAAASPPRAAPPPPARSASAHPDIIPAAPLEVANRVPLRPTCPPFQPRDPQPAPRPRDRAPAAFHPPAYSQMIPIPGYAGFPPFPGAVPLYPPLYPPPPAVLFPHPPFAPAFGPPPPTSPGHRCPGSAPHPPAHTCSGPTPTPTAPHIRSETPPPPPAFQSCPTSQPDRPSDPPPVPPAARPSSPPPPYNGTPGPERARVGPAAGEVTLSVSECEIFRLLSSVDPNAAHWYMVDAISRAMSSAGGAGGAGGPAARSSLNPAAPEFRAPLPPGMRPPPGFGY